MLDIATDYEVQLKAIKVAKDKLIADASTGLTDVMKAAKGIYDKTNGDMETSRDKVKKLISETAGFENELKKLEYAKTVEDRENTNYAKIAADMLAQQKAIDAVIGDVSKGLTKKETDAKGVLGASVAAGLLKVTADKDKAQKDAKKLYVAQIAKAKKSATDMAKDLLALEKLLGEAKALDAGDVLKAQTDYDNWLKLQVKEAGVVAAKEVIKVDKIVECEAL